tara:strand:- start:1136 stop:1315 length:180 start_codon:yes stop_codon:yes gene_type:complete
MRKFKYYSNNNKDKEASGMVLAESKAEALKSAAIRKNLDITKFLLLFNIIEVKDNEKSF